MTGTAAVMLLILLVAVLTNLVGAATADRPRDSRRQSRRTDPLIIDRATAAELAKIHHETDAAAAELTALYNHTLAELRRLH